MKNNYSIRTPKKIILRPLDFKLAVAEHILNDIPNKMPKQNFEHMLLEANAEAFIFFCSSVIDVIKREINEKFKIFDKDNVFYIHGIRKKLADSGTQKKVKQIIADYFTTPTHETTKHGWNSNQSSLWRLQILRNQAMHGNILKRKKNGNGLSFVYTIHEYKKQGRKPYEFIEYTNNPKKYFEEIFDDLCKFVKKTRRLIHP